MRLVLIGTGPFAVPAFRGLYETNHTIVALVTKPFVQRQGRRRVPFPPLRDLAHARGTPIIDPMDLNGEQARPQLLGCQADLLVVCDYGQILSAATLSTSRLGGINLHGSLLPRYRGAAPINWAIYHGETETGISVIHMTPRLDAGPVMAQGTLAIDPEETAVELEDRLAEIGSWLVRRAIDSIEAGRWEALPQDPALASKAPRLKKTDGLIDWKRPAAAIKNQVRAMQPWPKAYTFWRRPDGEPLRLVVGPVSVIDEPGRDVPPGTVLEASGDRLLVASSQGAVLLNNVQPAGKRMLSATEFLCGYRVKPGQLLVAGSGRE